LDGGVAEFDEVGAVRLAAARLWRRLGRRLGGRRVVRRRGVLGGALGHSTTPRRSSSWTRYTSSSPSLIHSPAYLPKTTVRPINSRISGSQVGPTATTVPLAWALRFCASSGMRMLPILPTPSRLMRTRANKGCNAISLSLCFLASGSLETGFCVFQTGKARKREASGPFFCLGRELEAAQGAQELAGLVGERQPEN